MAFLLPSRRRGGGARQEAANPVAAQRHSWVLRALGALLLVAAALKGYGLALDPLPQAGWFSDPLIQFAIIEIEVILGLWFVSGWRSEAAWAIALAIFSVFGLVSLLQGLGGQASCGCFGNLPVTPWLALALDGIALGALIIGRPKITGGDRLRLFRDAVMTVAPLAAGAAAILLFLAGLGFLFFGSPAEALAHIRGELIAVRPALASLGQAPPGATREVTLEIKNWTSDTVHVLGAPADCACVVTSRLPLAIPPRESAHLTLRVRFPNQPGQFTRRAGLWTDQEHMPLLNFRISGRTEHPIFTGG